MQLENAGTKTQPIMGHYFSGQFIGSMVTKWTLAKVKKLNKMNFNPKVSWFGKKEMQFFDGRIESRLSVTNMAFVDSTQFHGSQSSLPRVYHVRQVLADGRIETVIHGDNERDFATYDSAFAYMKTAVKLHESWERGIIWAMGQHYAKPLYVTETTIDKKQAAWNGQTWFVTSEEYTLKGRIDSLLASDWKITRMLDDIIEMKYNKDHTKGFKYQWRYAEPHESPGTYKDA